jgi:hypothetical protein
VIVLALSPKLTLFELLNVNALARLLVVPALRLNEPCVEATVTDAVTRVEPLIPNVTLFEFEKTTVPEVAVCVPAASAPGAVDCANDALAVTVLAFNPNDTLLEFENVKADARLLVVPALTLKLPWVLATVTEAVIVDAFRPKLTLFAFEKVKALARFDVVPAETLNDPCELATVAEAVTVLPLRPKLTLLLFDSTNAVRLLLVVPALTFTLAAPAATDAVICDEPDIPNDTPFEFTKTKEPLVPVWVPAASAEGPVDCE